MNTIAKNSFLALSLILFLATSSPSAQAASPWTQHEGYWAKTGGKFLFGLKNSLFGWVTPWAESKSSNYKTEWEAWSAGVGHAVINTAGGLIHLATFPFPIDFPDFGKGLHIPDQNCPNNPYGVSVPPASEA